MVEIWKDIENYEGYYQVSNKGRVKSLERDISCRGRKHTLKMLYLKEDVSDSGYKRVTLSKKSVTKRFLTHRLVAKAFLENPENKPFINHIDNNPQNNTIKNLEYVTHSENMLHAQRQKRLHKNQSKGGLIAGKAQTEEMYKRLENTIGQIYGCIKILRVTEERAKNGKALLEVICLKCNSLHKHPLNYLKIRSPKRCKNCRANI